MHVDPRVELFCILNALAGAGEYNQGVPSPYLDAVKEHFRPFTGHPAVTATATLRKEHGITFDAPMALAVHLTAVPELAPLRPWKDIAGELDERWQQVDIPAYLALVRDFVETSELQSFLAAQAPYIQQVQDAFGDYVADHMLVAFFDQVFGQRSQASYVIVPGLMTGRSNYGPSATGPDGTEHLYQILSLENVDEQGRPRLSEATLELLVHEMAHPFVNPLLGAHGPELAPVAEPLYGRVASAMESQAYGTWQTMVNESGVRAITLLYVKEHLGADRFARLLAEERERGFFWVGELSDLVARTVAQGGTFADAVPAVAGVLASWHEDHPGELPWGPFRGPIYRAFTRGPLVQVRGPDTKGTSRAVIEYVQRIHERRRFAGAPLVWGGAEVLPQGAVVLYGSPRDNKAVRALLDAFGWRVGRGEIVLGERRFGGEHLVLIACHPHPAGGKHPVVLYAAGDSRDLVGIDGVFHGPTDWLVARRSNQGTFEVVAQGMFPRGAAGEWLPLRPAQ